MPLGFRFKIQEQQRTEQVEFPQCPGFNLDLQCAVSNVHIFCECMGFFPQSKMCGGLLDSLATGVWVTGRIWSNLQ